MDQIERHTVPGNGQYVGAKSYYIINQDKKNKMVKEIFGVSGPFDEDITLEAIEARVAADEGLPAEGDETQTGERDDSAMDTAIEAEELLSYVNDYGDLENPDVAAAYETLRSAIASGDVNAMRSAMSTVRNLLPGA